MILIRKTDKSAVNIYLDGTGVSCLRSELDTENIEVDLDAGSVGFKGKQLRILRITVSDKNQVEQIAGSLSIDIEKDELDYFKYKLDQYFLDFDFIPEELFTLSQKGRSIHFYLTKIDYLE